MYEESRVWVGIDAAKMFIFVNLGGVLSGRKLPSSISNRNCFLGWVGANSDEGDFEFPMGANLTN